VGINYHKVALPPSAFPHPKIGEARTVSSKHENNQKWKSEEFNKT
jgi:hypothetical protein